MKNTVVTIPQPCHENWNVMLPEEQGRFCRSCEKIVVDFTNKTPVEIRETLMQNTGKVCGRVKKTDLNRPLEEPVVKPVLVPVKQSWFKAKWMAAAAMFTALFIGKKALAQEEVLGNITVRPEPPKQNQQVSCKPSPTIIRGQIKSLDPAKGLSQVEIKVYSNGKEVARTFAFNSGYVLTVPEHTIWDFKVTVEANAMGYETKVLQDVPTLKDQIALDILLTPLSDEVINGAPVIFEPQYFVMGDIVEETYVVGQLEVPEAPEMPEYKMGDVKVEPQTKEDTSHTAALVPKTPDNKAFNTKTGQDKPAVKKVVVNFPEIMVKAYPNPGNGLFTLSIPKGHPCEVFVYNLEGKMVLSKKTNLEQETIDITQEPNGVYLVKVIQTGTSKTAQVRVIKTK